MEIVKGCAASPPDLPVTMSWVRSRRFFAGFLAGLVPLLFLAAQSSPDRSDALTDEPVIVRTYAGCCPDENADRRTAALVETLPPGGVLVETFTGCCGCDTTTVNRGQAR